MNTTTGGLSEEEGKRKTKKAGKRKRKISTKNDGDKAVLENETKFTHQDETSGNKKGKSNDGRLVSEGSVQKLAAPMNFPRNPENGKYSPKDVSFPHRYILAPMVGASELAFRLLCRRYGTELAYTPMMSAQKFASSQSYREEEFQTCPQDRPLVCHFAANDPNDFAAAARIAEPWCDAIDLNLGCPQRTAYIGHFGSYLLEDKDRELVCSIVREGAKAVKIPIFCKIRLLDTIEDTIRLCQALRDSGASLIAIHARYRASWERKGPGARDGPALLDQVLEIKKAITDIPIIANGNTITYDDVENNLKLTQADGLMSAEGILDNPALFVPRLHEVSCSSSTVMSETTKIKLDKKQRKIASLDKKLTMSSDVVMDEDRKYCLKKKLKAEHSLRQLLINGNSEPSTQQRSEFLELLHARSADELVLAQEYLELATIYPVKMRSVIFHVRRMLKALLDQYQLMEECLSASSIVDIFSTLNKIRQYRENPEMFVFDKAKAQRDKEALERKRLEEGKRKAYEARMLRKAKREGKKDPLHYLHIGAELPSNAIIANLKSIPRAQALEKWMEKHSQHCFAFHLEPQGCRRGRACAFLHVEVVLGCNNTFDEKEEVSG
ncbi:hypothetical protein ACA910_002744 [Epithemia clementina (nom. ined.)]